MDADLLKNYGVDFDKGLKNCMGNLPFYKKILSMFLQDQCFAKGKEAYAAGDQKELFCRMHELKGISGNAALMTLYEATVPLVELLRKDGGSTAETSRLFAGVEEAYGRACEGIAIVLTDNQQA